MSRPLTDLCALCPIKNVIENEPERMKEKDLARVLNRSIASLRDWRRKMKSGQSVGPVFVREEGRVYYPKAAVVGYMLRTTCQPNTCLMKRAMTIVATILICIGIVWCNSDSDPANDLDEKLKPAVHQVHRSARWRRQLAPTT